MNQNSNDEIVNKVKSRTLGATKRLIVVVVLFLCAIISAIVLCGCNKITVYYPNGNKVITIKDGDYDAANDITIGALYGDRGVYSWCVKDDQTGEVIKIFEDNRLYADKDNKVELFEQFRRGKVTIEPYEYFVNLQLVSDNQTKVINVKYKYNKDGIIEMDSQKTFETQYKKIIDDENIFLGDVWSIKSNNSDIEIIEDGKLKKDGDVTYLSRNIEKLENKTDIILHVTTKKAVLHFVDEATNGILVDQNGNKIDDKIVKIGQALESEWKEPYKQYFKFENYYFKTQNGQIQDINLKSIRENGWTNTARKLTIYARFSVQKIRITYNYSESDSIKVINKIPSVDVDYCSKLSNVNLNVPQAIGWTFAGWKANRNGGEKSISDSKRYLDALNIDSTDFDIVYKAIPESNVAGEIVFTAQWDPTRWELTLDGGSAKNVVYATSLKQYLTKPDIPDQTKPCFVGWVEADSGTKYTIADTMPAKDLSLVSVWAVHKPDDSLLVVSGHVQAESYKCTVCKANVAVEHIYGDDIIVQATLESEGRRYKVCDCGYEKTIETYPRLIKLDAPTLTYSVKNGAGSISVQNGKNYGFAYAREGLDYVNFNGDLKTFTQEGTYYVVCYNKAQKSNEITSDYSEPLTLIKLASPALAIEDGELIATSNSTVEYNLDGRSFSGDLTLIKTAGDHVISAKAVAKDNSNEINSQETYLSIVKLSVPTISAEGSTLTASGVNVKAIVNGDAVEDLSSFVFEQGDHSVTVYSQALTEKQLSSESLTVSIHKSSAPAIYKEGAKILSNDVNVYYTVNGNPVAASNGGIVVSGDQGEYEIVARIGKTTWSTTTSIEFESDATTVTYSKLAKPQISFNGGNLSYSEGATLYNGDSLFNTQLLTDQTVFGTFDIYAINHSTEDDVLDSDSSVVLTIVKLDTPSLSIVNGQLRCECENLGIIKYYVNDEVFGGDLSTLSKSGTYAISAVNESNGNYQISSPLSDSVVVTRLSAPTLKVESDKVTVVGNTVGIRYNYRKSTSTTWGVQNNGALSFNDSEETTYVITAVKVGSGDNELDSAPAEITVTKLGAPRLSKNNGLISAVGGKNIKYYYVINNEKTEFDGNQDNLPFGNCTVYAINKGDAATTLDSNSSNVLYFERAKLVDRVAFYLTGTNQVKIDFYATDLYDGSMNCYVEFYKKGVAIDSLTRNNVSKFITIGYDRGGKGVADKIVVTVTATNLDGTTHTYVDEFIIS